MAEPIEPGFPGGSKSRVNRAGEAIRAGIASAEDLHVIDEWRAAHRAVLNTFNSMLRHRTRGKRIAVAQRHKRKRTIFDKLNRFPKMHLSRMDDVAGCRLIFRTIRDMYEFRKNLHKARFNHRLRNEIDRYDYIKQPKPTGYRGIHDVYEYDVKSEVGKRLAGLYVEIQYRTLVQHAWATAVEVVGFITESQPKFQQGDKRYEYAMALASEILARTYEHSKGPFPSLENKDLVDKFLVMDKDLGLLQTLRGLNAAGKHVAENRNTILIFSATSELEIQTFRDAPEALRALFELEKQFPDRDIVLVRAESSDEIRLAFTNYFSDAKEFIRMVENGCSKLCGIKEFKAQMRKPK